MPDIYSKEQLTNHPNHYNRDGALECWDEMELIWGPEALLLFCEMNAWKYRYRAGSKGDKNLDLEKSDVYMKKAKEIRDKIGRPQINLGQ